MNNGYYPQTYTCPHCGATSNASVCPNPQCLEADYRQRAPRPQPEDVVAYYVTPGAVTGMVDTWCCTGNTAEFTFTALDIASVRSDIPHATPATREGDDIVGPDGRRYHCTVVYCVTNSDDPEFPVAMWECYRENGENRAIPLIYDYGSLAAVQVDFPYASTTTRQGDTVIGPDGTPYSIEVEHG